MIFISVTGGSASQALKKITHMKSIKTKIVSAIVVIFAIAGCSEDFLERPPLSDISADNFYKTTADMRLATAALYAGKPWGEWNYEVYLPVGEVLSGNMAVGYWDDAVQLHTFTVTGLNQIMVKNWKGMYKVIAHCNATINAIEQKAPATIPAAERNAAIAEAKFIRAFAYYNLAIHWGAVPIIEDNSDLVTQPLVPRHKVEDVYQFIANDLRFATYNLPLTDAAGRVTAWSAAGMLGKTYLTMAGLESAGAGPRNQALLDSAKLYAGVVCNQSGKELMENYPDLFKTQFNDNQESLFALQWAAGLGWLEGNMLQIYCTAGNDIAPNGGGGWFSIAPTIDMYEQYSEADSIRRKATFMLKGDYYPELNAAGGGFRYMGTGPGLKKHIVGTNADNNSALMNRTSSPEHNAMLRLADVYLIYVEAILGNNAVTADGEALKFFNKVRTRAKLEPVTSITADMLMKERRIELAAEGLYWQDLVRLSMYNSAKAINILNTTVNETKRVVFNYDNGVVTPGNGYGELTPANANTFIFPVPSSEITANPKLSQTPVSYTF
jgi:hypothetical protein